ncbi:MAG: hypothetical protein ACPGVT_05230 [Maricaulaceae bacterium]
MSSISKIFLFLLLLISGGVIGLMVYKSTVLRVDDKYALTEEQKTNTHEINLGSSVFSVAVPKTNTVSTSELFDDKYNVNIQTSPFGWDQVLIAKRPTSKDCHFFQKSLSKGRICFNIGDSVKVVGISYDGIVMVDGDPHEFLIRSPAGAKYAFDFLIQVADQGLPK